MRKYDILLGLIPTSGISIGGLTQLMIDSVLTSIVAGSIFAAVIIGYAMFIDPPRDPVLGPHQ